MQNLPKILEQAKAEGLTIKQFCTYCTNAADGELTMQDGDGNTFPLPICEGCVEVLKERFPDKFV